jgi:putative DNA primase/helicase
MDRLFRQSGLYRDKWDRPDYRKMTIEKACEMTLDAGMRGGAGGNGEGAGVTTTTQMPFALTEYGNAERLINRYGMDIRHCNIFQKWFFWDGTQWVIDREQYLVQLAKFTVRGIYAEAARIEQEELRKATAQWARRSERAVSITAMLKLAESEPGIPVLPEELDSDRWLLNCLNCTIDLRSGDPMQHRRDCLITKAAPVEYDPGAECRRWMLFLKEVFAPHPDIIPFIQRAVGYSLTGDTREECLFLLWGTGRNGKGTFIKTVASMLGDYAGTADFSTFVRSRNEGGPRDDVANMKGKRFVSAQEAREGSALAESLIKWVTGGDRVRARRLYENSYEFDPTHKIWLATNHKPVIRGTDPAIWSRIKLVPFEVSFEGREDKTLKETLQAELPGVLAWAVQGCRQWKCEGLSFPESVLSATQVYRHESDQVARFIEESCELDPRNRVKGRVLYQRYRKWAEDTGETPSSEKAFGSRITQRFQKEHKETGAVYVGIALKQGYCDCDNPAQSSDKSAGG